MNFSNFITNSELMLKKISVFIAIFSFFFSDAQSDIAAVNKPKQFAIEGAQSAHQSHLYAQKSYFTRNQINASFYNDTALNFIEQSLILIDSAIVLASKTDTLALDYAYKAKKVAGDTYNLLSNYPNSIKQKEYSYSAMFLAANVTTDAYTASL